MTRRLTHNDDLSNAQVHRLVDSRADDDHTAEIRSP
jgi:hypothetical protein